MKRKELVSSQNDREDEGTSRASKCIKMTKGVDTKPLLLLADVAYWSREETPSRAIPHTRTKPNVQVTRPYPNPVLISPPPPHRPLLPPPSFSAIAPFDWRRPPDFVTQFTSPRSMVVPLYPRRHGLPRCTIHSHDLPPHIRAAMGPYSLTMMRNSGKSSGGNVVPLIEPLTGIHDAEKRAPSF
jgi:hypothetical protein